MKVEVGGEIIEVMKPIGRMGALHFSIMAKAIPDKGAKSKEDIEALKDVPMSPEERENMMDAFVDWSTRVLPNIIIGGKDKFDQLTGEQQMGIFMAVMDSIDLGKNSGGELFRVIE